jgi:hypothetical protein
MQKGSRVIVALSVLVGMIAGASSGVSDYSGAKHGEGTCLAAQSLWDAQKAIVASVKASGKQPREMTNDELVAMYRDQKEVHLPRPVCEPINFWMAASKSIFAALGAFLVTFIAFHIAWLVGRAYNKLMRKLS